MTSLSAQWHLHRRQSILKHCPDVARLPKSNPIALLTILLIPVLYALTAYLCQFLSISTILVLAWTVGSRLTFSMFKYSHEISHRLVSTKLSRSANQLLLRYINCLNLSTSVYLLFHFGHKPHHAGLGSNTLTQAKRFLSEKYPDIELLLDRYYYELAHDSNAPAQSLHPTLFNHPIRRIVSVGFLYPIISSIKGTVLFHLIYLVKYFKRMQNNNDIRYQQRLNDSMIQIILLYSLITPLALLVGFKALLFLFLSDLSQRGFLWHPISIFTITSHKAWNNQRENQPTTSCYGQVLSWLLMGMNYHVEHHDFPDIPCRYLYKLRQLAPHFYQDLNHYQGYFDALTNYIRSQHWYYVKVDNAL